MKNSKNSFSNCSETGTIGSGRRFRLLALLQILFLFLAPAAEACVLCEALKKAKSHFGRAGEQEQRAQDATAAGDARMAFYANCRALTLRANACYKIRSSKSKFGAALVNAKLAAIWPDAPSEAECEALIDAFQGKPSVGGAGGLGGSGGGAGGQPGGPPGSGESGSARSGAVGASGPPPSTVNPAIFIAGNDADDLPADFEVVISPSVAHQAINLTSPSSFTETGIADGEVRVTGLSPSANAISVSIGSQAVPGDFATWTYTVRNTTTGEFLPDTGFSFSVTVVSPMGAGGGGDAIVITPKGEFVKKTTDNSSPVTLEWEIRNNGTSDVDFWIAVGPATDSLSRDTLINSLVPHDIFDYFTSPPTVGPATQPALPNPPEAPMSLLVPVTAPGGAGGGPAQTLSVPMPPGNLCEDGMTVCCALRAFFQSGTDGNDDPIYELIAEQVAPQYIFNQTAVESNNLISMILITGEIDQFVELPLLVNVNGTQVEVELLPGEKGSDVGEAIAQAVNEHPGRIDGSFPANGMSGPNMAIISGYPANSVTLDNTFAVPGLRFAFEESVASTDVSNISVTPVSGQNGFWTVTADVTVDTNPTQGIASDIMARLEVNGAPFGEPVVIGANGMPPSSQQTFPVVFDRVVLGGLKNTIAVRVDPAGAVTESTGNAEDNTGTEMIEMAFTNIQPESLPQGLFGVQGPPNFGVSVLFSEDLESGSFTRVAAGATDGTGMGMIPLPGSTQGLDKAFFRGAVDRPQVPHEIIPAGGAAPTIVHALLDPVLIQSSIQNGANLSAQLLGVNVIDAETGAPAPGAIQPNPSSIQTRVKKTLRPDPKYQSMGIAYEGAMEISFELTAQAGTEGKTFYVDTDFGITENGNPTGHTELTPLVVDVAAPVATN